jgi:hypothetical protein
MRKFEIKHPEYGKLGQFDKYVLRDFYNAKNLPKRADFQFNVLPNVPYGQNKPDPKHEADVTKRALEILGKVFLDGKPLTNLYDWKMNVSSFNPSGRGTPKWNYYLVGTLNNSGTVNPQELKEMVTEAVLAVMNKRI